LKRIAIVETFDAWGNPKSSEFFDPSEGVVKVQIPGPTKLEEKLRQQELRLWKMEQAYLYR